MIREQLEKEGPAICETKQVATDAGNAGNDVSEKIGGDCSTDCSFLRRCNFTEASVGGE